MYSFSTLVKRISKYIKPYKALFIFTLFIGAIYVVLCMYAPYIIGIEIIALFDDQATFDIAVLTIPLIKLGVITIVSPFFGIAMNYLFSIISYRMIKDIRLDVFNKLLKVPVGYLDSHVHGDILTRVTHDVDTTWDGLLHGFSHLFKSSITIVVTIVFMFITKWDIALIVTLLTPLSVLGVTLVAKFSHKSFKDQAKITGVMGGFTNEMISAQRTVIAYDLNHDNDIHYQELDKQLYKVGVRAQFTAAFARPSTRFFNSLIYAAVSLYGTLWIVRSSKQDIATMIGILSVFLVYTNQYIRPFNEVSEIAPELISAFASLRRILELIDEKELPDESNLNEITSTHGEFNLNNVNFSYNKNKQILKDISFKVNENKKVAIVGRTGCGKTTLINLLMRFYNVDSGEILFDRQNINKIKRISLRNNVGMVLQDTWLFKGTVKDNIRYGKPNATDDEVIVAAKLVNADDFISKLENGYDTIIDDDDGLSTGEKQLICIARLMINLPKVLILDEATSNIDTRTEVRIQKAFNIMMNGRTSVVIAHRLSTIRNADLIIVLKDGEVIETGNHEQLIKKKGYYNELYNSL